MKRVTTWWLRWVLPLGLAPLLAAVGAAAGDWKDDIYHPGQLKATDSVLKVAVGDPAPDFELPSLSGERVRLSQFRGRRHVVISFVPAAWTPVCSDQWPGYNIIRPMFEENNAILLGITVDSLPTLHAWTRQMGQLWFPVLSDFWPHGAAAERFGLLRSDGVSERALLVVDMQGVIRYIDVSDINVRPKLDRLLAVLQGLSK
jgi:peroxiredoxin (alkyl hydroperoxide reductase subunit C)